MGTSSAYRLSKLDRDDQQREAFQCDQDDDDEPNLGPCCNCERTDGVRNIVLINRRAPISGHGWGCVICGLPCDGAVAVLCDDCLDKADPPRFVCSGYLAKEGRVPYGDLSPEEFDHDRTKHEDGD